MIFKTIIVDIGYNLDKIQYTFLQVGQMLNTLTLIQYVQYIFVELMNFFKAFQKDIQSSDDDDDRPIVIKKSKKYKRKIELQDKRLIQNQNIKKMKNQQSNGKQTREKYKPEEENTNSRDLLKGKQGYREPAKMSRKEEVSFLKQKQKIKIIPQSFKNIAELEEINENIQFIKRLQRGRLLKGVFIGIKNQQYEMFLCRDDTPVMININEKTIKTVQITNPDKDSIKIETKQFKDKIQKQFHTKAVELGTINFSTTGFITNLYANQSDLFSSPTRDGVQQSAEQNKHQYYCMQKSFIIVKKQITFDKKRLSLDEVFLKIVKQLEKQFLKLKDVKQDQNQNERKKITKKIHKQIFEEYGTHFYIGAYTIGGRYDYIVESQFQSNVSKQYVHKTVNNKIQASIMFNSFCNFVNGFDNNFDNSYKPQPQNNKQYKLQIIEQYISKGGSGKTAQEFIKKLQQRGQWRVLGESKMYQSYIPIWQIIKNNPKNISQKFIDQLQRAYYLLLKHKFQLEQKRLNKINERIYQKNKKDINQRLLKNKGTGFGALKIDDKQTKYIGYLLNKEAHGTGILYKDKKQSYTGVWKQGQFVQGFCCSQKNHKATFFKMDDDEIQNQEIYFSMADNKCQQNISSISHEKSIQIKNIQQQVVASKINNNNNIRAGPVQDFKSQLIIKVYVAYYIHWSEKQHYGKILGVFTDRKKAIQLIYIYKDQPDCEHVNKEQTFHAVYQSCPENFNELKFGMYIIDGLFTTQNKQCLTFSINVKFPIQVWCRPWQNYQQEYIKKIENEVRRSVVLQIQKDNQKNKISEKSSFKTENKDVKIFKAAFVCKIYKDSNFIFCIACAKQNTELLLCGKCKRVRYCNRQCQINDWSRHKSQCVKKGL